jgi:hypothetical protein
MELTKASIDEYTRALLIVADTNDMLDKIKARMETANFIKKMPDTQVDYDEIIKKLLLCRKIQYRD